MHSVTLVAVTLSLCFNSHETSVKKAALVKGTAMSDMASEKEVLTIKLNIAEGWQLFANPVGNKWLSDYRTSVTVFRDGKAVSAMVEYPRGLLYRDGSDEYYYYETSIVIRATVNRADPKAALSVEVVYHAMTPSTRILNRATRLMLSVEPVALKK